MLLETAGLKQVLSLFTDLRDQVLAEHLKGGTLEGSPSSGGSILSSLVQELVGLEHLKACQLDKQWASECDPAPYDSCIKMGRSSGDGKKQAQKA